LDHRARRPRGGAVDRVGGPGAVRSPACRRRTRAGAAPACGLHQVSGGCRRPRRLRFSVQRGADGNFDGPADPRADCRPAGLDRAAMAAVDRSAVDRAVAAPVGLPAAGDRRCRCTDLLALVLGLSYGSAVQLLYRLGHRKARLRTGSRIRRGADLGARNNGLQSSYVLGDPPADRPGNPGGHRRRARSGPAGGGSLVALGVHRSVGRHLRRAGIESRSARAPGSRAPRRRRRG